MAEIKTYRSVEDYPRDVLPTQVHLSFLHLHSPLVPISTPLSSLHFSPHLHSTLLPFDNSNIDTIWMPSQFNESVSLDDRSIEVKYRHYAPYPHLHLHFLNSDPFILLYSDCS